MFTRLKTFPIWAFLSLLANAVLLLAVSALLWRNRTLLAPTNKSDTLSVSNGLMSKTLATQPQLGQRHQLDYQRWLEILGKEAEAAALQKPKHLNVLAGDSLSLWFPSDLLPTERNWLNQGISGETSAGLLKRVDLFDQTQPEKIFVMIGINDLIRGIKPDTLLANQRLIVHHLRKAHPRSQIILQSILPHAGKKATWEGRDRLLVIPSSRIRDINQKLAAIAAEEGVTYLDLYSLFTDQQGYLRPELTTDGLHLSSQGYLVWRSAILLFSQLQAQNQHSNSQILNLDSKN